jgi:hypothetical protein
MRIQNPNFTGIFTCLKRRLIAGNRYDAVDIRGASVVRLPRRRRKSGIASDRSICAYRFLDGLQCP